MKELYGLCRGRHEMDVSGYIFDNVEDVFDFDEFHRIAVEFIKSHCDVIEITFDDGIRRPVGMKQLEVVVTGLTALTSEIVGACAEMRTNLVLWHYDRETGTYHPQRFAFRTL